MGFVHGYIGTYSAESGEGVYGFQLDENGRLAGGQLLYEAPGAKYLSLRNGLLASTVKRGMKAGVCLAHVGEGMGEVVQEVLLENEAPCYAAQDEEYIYTANYHLGNVMVYRKMGQGVVWERALVSRLGAGCHQAVNVGGYLLVPCLKLEEIMVFDRRQLFQQVGSIKFPDGSGPRHCVYDDRQTVYVVCELSNQVFAYEVKDGSFDLREVIPIVPEGSTAAVRLSPDKRFLYVSTRGVDVLTVLSLERGKMELAQQVSCGGKHPRDFLLSKDGRYLLTANRDSGDVVCFARDGESGKIGEETGRIEVKEAVSLALTDGS